VLEVFNTALS